MKYIAFLAITVLLSACGDTTVSLDEKKSQLVELKNQLETVKTEITVLEKEIALLDTATDNRKPKLTTIADVKVAPFYHYIDVQGTVESDENIAIQPGMPGVVTKVYVREGDRVSAGQLLAETDNRAIRESVTQLETNLELAKTTFEKQKRLWEQKIGSEIQYLQAKTQFESLQSTIASTKAQLDMTRIKAPVTGVIDEVNVKVGEYAAPGLGLFRLVNTNNVKVTAKIADSYIRNLKIGDKVNVTFNDLGETVEGKISFISKVVNPMSRTFAIEVTLDKNTADIRPNMMASLSINDQVIDSIATVPSNMIQKDAAGRLYIMVAEKDGNAFVARKKQVKPGISYGAFTVIEEGLSGNEKIVTSAYQEIVDGQPISIN